MITTGESSPQEIQESAHIILDQTAHITAVIRQLLDFARPNKPVPSDVDLAELARHTAHLLGHLASERRVKLVLADPARDAGARRCRADPPGADQPDRKRATGRVGGQVGDGAATGQPRVGPGGGSRRDFACLAVQDEGRASRRKICRACSILFTTKPVGEGSGLGSRLRGHRRRKRRLHRSAESTLGQGSCFSISSTSCQHRGPANESQPTYRR